MEGHLLFNRDLLVAVLEAARSQHCSISLDLGSLLGSHVVRHIGATLPDSDWNRIIMETTAIPTIETPAPTPMKSV